MEPDPSCGHVGGVSSDDASDADLWARACAGEGTAIAGLYDRYAHRIHAYCFRRVGSFQLVQDLTSTVWLEAWRRRNSVVPHQDGSLAPWLFGIAHNTVRNSERSQRRHQAALSRLPAPDLEPDHSDAVAQRLDDERRMILVLQGVNQLRPHERDVLALVVWGGLDHAQAAAALRISVGTVKSRLSRARTRLRSIDPASASGAERTATAAPAITRRFT